MVNLTNEENFNMGKIFLNNNLLFKSLSEKSSIQNNYRIYSNNNKNIFFFVFYLLPKSPLFFTNQCFKST